VAVASIACLKIQNVDIPDSAKRNEAAHPGRIGLGGVPPWTVDGGPETDR